LFNILVIQGYTIFAKASYFFFAGQLPFRWSFDYFINKLKKKIISEYTCRQLEHIFTKYNLKQQKRKIIMNIGNDPKLKVCAVNIFMSYVLCLSVL